MSIWERLRRLDERVGLLRGKGPLDCRWCDQSEHEHCTGVAVRLPPSVVGMPVIGSGRAETETCACSVRGHA